MKKRMITCSLLVAAMAAASVQAEMIEWYDYELGLSGGSSTLQSWTKDGYTLNVSTIDGYLTNYQSGEFAGLWLAQKTSSDGTYIIDLDGVAMNSLEFEFDAASNGGSGEPERFLDWEISIGGGFIAVSDIVGMDVAGSTMDDLVLTSIVNDGMATVTITSDTGPFTWFAFRHTQDISQDGSVIERVLIDAVPTPGVASLLLLGCVVINRQRRSI